MLEAAAEFAQGEFAPLNDVGDRRRALGRRRGDHAAGLPRGLCQVRRGRLDGPCRARRGGRAGASDSLSAAMMEDFNAANVAFRAVPDAGARRVEAIEVHGSDELKRDYLPKIVSGEWTGDDEPDRAAGRQRRRRAEDARGAGRRRQLADQRDQDLHHLWRARPDRQDRPHGAGPHARRAGRHERHFAVPGAENPARRQRANDLRCVSIEHKMGIHASPTCVMGYGDKGGAIGWLVGPENGGMRAMFTMMNNARLNVGLQGVGIAERATQRAVAYALEREQGQRDRLARARSPTIPTCGGCCCGCGR